MNVLYRGAFGLAGVLIASAAVAAYHTTESYQVGNAGVAMQLTETRARLSERLAANRVPAALPAASDSGMLAVDAYKNVQVLGHLSSGEFTRLMTAMTLWVAPNNGCAYCHAPERTKDGKIVVDEDGSPQADLNNMQSDELYTKRVARRMLQMTMHINTDWKGHVRATGVTCYTCHRGNPVPTNIWFDQEDVATRYQGIGSSTGAAGPSPVAGLTSLPHAPYQVYFDGAEEIRVQATEALGSPDRSSIKQTEWTYGLMISMSESLGVNCTYCHNSRSFGDWSTSPTARATAWYGIRMVRDLNHSFLEPLASTLPPNRHGPLGDGPKLHCGTCHAGAFKPLLGVSMLAEYPELAEARPQPQKMQAAAESDAGAAAVANATAAANAATAPIPGAGGPGTTTDAGASVPTTPMGSGAPAANASSAPALRGSTASSASARPSGGAPSAHP